MTATILTFVSRHDLNRAKAQESATDLNAARAAMAKALTTLAAALDRRAPEVELNVLRRLARHAKIAAALGATRFGAAHLRAA